MNKHSNLYIEMKHLQDKWTRGEKVFLIAALLILIVPVTISIIKAFV